ncbi:TolC family protein [Quatrionicoccus australiensis]|uniref:TolC family protein n=1 Tax=Quatrionicoccus australiensis TaxID=138118 RepID=UPI001CFA6F46|nr:TolC family protein [Quatrionicoccus australiensis]MCB4360471.1 TolC family protein [Quatrionicoccus australiensis]
MSDFRYRRAGLAIMLSVWLGQAGAGGIDPFLTHGKVAGSVAGNMLDADDDSDPCVFGPPAQPLELPEAVERALCNNPQTRAAWAGAKVQTAQVGVAKSAYLPAVAGVLAYSKQKNVTRYGEESPYSVFNNLPDSKPNLRSGSLKMSQVLTDFGLRSANLDQAMALLDAANASHDAALQIAFVNAAQAYFDTQTTQAVLEASREAEHAARESFNAAAAKYKAGIGALTDQLQAQVAYSKASLERVSAEGELKNAQGTLATAMGLSATTNLVLPRRREGLPDTAFVKPAEDLIEEAKQHHPTLLAAQAEVKAARAKIAATRAEGRPTVTLTAELGRTEQENQPPAVGYAPTDISNRNNSLGIQMNIPLFEGFGRNYRTQTAQGQAEIKAAELSRLEQQISLEVWKSYQSLRTENENMKAADVLVSSARQSFLVAQGRFKAGVGNILELLSAQSAVAGAEQQRIKSISNWHTARLKLAANIGKLGLWAIR